MKRPDPARVGFVPIIDRRSWIGYVTGLLVPLGVWADDEMETREAIERAEVRGLKPFRILRSKHYVAVGNAPDDYLRITLLDCEDVARDFMEHFQSKGFKVAYPKQKMTAVVLADERAYARFIPERTPHGANGIFLIKSNWLVVQDYRNVPRAQSDVPVWAENLRTLAHEATHQITFNADLLNRDGDVPRCISEGLGIYGEMRRPRTRSLPGQVNRTRLADLAHYRRGLGWIPLSRLLTDESWFSANDGGKILLSYAQSWLLVHYLMTSDPARTEAFRKYLEAIHDRRAADLRLNDARTHLGDLDKLDAELKQYSVGLLNAK